MAISRTSLVRLAAGDPGIFSLIKTGISFLSKGVAQTGAEAIRGGGGRRALPAILERAGGIIRKPATIAGAGGAILGAGGALAARGIFGGGANIGSIDGFATIMGRTGRIRRLISPTGRVINVSGRRRGISAVELRGFRKVARLLSSVGMVPARHRRKRHA